MSTSYIEGSSLNEWKGKNTAEAKCLNYMKQHWLTSMSAYEKFGVTRLAAIVFKLRRKGVKIIDMEQTGVNKYGNRVTFKKYRVDPEWFKEQKKQKKENKQ